MTTYRKMCDLECSLLGFGCMRFPTNKDGSINEAKAEQMIDEAMLAGINYYDTAYGYHGGDSERFLGKVLPKYPRESYFLTSKLPVYMLTSAEHAEQVLEEQLSRLNADYLDFYLLHALNRHTFDERVVGFDLLKLCEKWKKEGKVRHIGFSFHDDNETFERILRYYPWDVCQIQYNYMDTENQAGLKGLKLAGELGIPVIVMEPIRGGSLVRFPEEIKDAFAQACPGRNLANIALSWVATHPEVKVILSGMSNLAQLRDNLKTFRRFTPLTEAQMQGVAGVVELIRGRIRVPCTACRYCMPCPAGVDIPRAFAITNEEAMHGHTEVYRKQYHRGKPETFASKCVKCGACVSKCPQHINIPEKLSDVKNLFE